MRRAALDGGSFVCAVVPGTVSCLELRAVLPRCLRGYVITSTKRALGGRGDDMTERQEKQVHVGMAIEHDIA